MARRAVGGADSPVNRRLMITGNVMRQCQHVFVPAAVGEKNHCPTLRLITTVRVPTAETPETVVAGPWSSSTTKPRFVLLSTTENL